MTKADENSAERVVLPTYVVPERYDLSLKPNLKDFMFDGTAIIDFIVNADQLDSTNNNKIILHAQELLFESASYRIDDGAAINADEINMSLKETTATFVFGTPIPATAESVQLTVTYKGYLNNQMAGFYRSTYKNIDGETCYMASTQFETLDARRAFPCVDEPAAKAEFTLHLTVPRNLTCMSNMPEECRVTLDSEWAKVSYQPSPRMSTYLLAFCVGEFDYLQATTEESGLPIRVYTPVGQSASGKFALDCAIQCLEKYNDFFQVPYPLPKLDMIAIPEFAAGAMENWGLVTYREVDLLIDPVKASSNQKQRVATVVCHELAHQWFGNLVTMDWWSGLWLNESFASWCENWATDQLYPSYHMWDQFVTGHMAAALRLDALKSSHPIDVPIRRAEEVNQVFDAISYCKGAAVVRMIKAVLGMKCFQGGLRTYMKEHAYGNTSSNDLWSAWENASGLPVGELMGSWTHQMGFPLLKVTSETWTNTQVTLELEQSWFLSDGSTPTEEKTWTIPIMTCTGAGPQEEMMLMREAKGSVTVNLTGKNDWIKLNAGQEVPMRVLCTSTMIQRYEWAIENKTMQPMDRAGLITDAYALVKARHMKPEDLMTLMGFYKKETEFVVWEGLASVLGGLETILSDDPTMSKYFRGFGKAFVLNLLEQVGWEASTETPEGEEHLTTLLRGLLIALLSQFAYDDPKVLSEATKRFQGFLANPNDVKILPSDMRSYVFKIILQNGGAREYNQVKSYYNTATDNAERKHVLNSLGSIQSRELKLKAMEWSTSGEIKIQDFFYCMGSVGRSNRLGRDVSWEYFQNNLGTIQGMISTANSALMDACIVMCCGGFSSAQKADEIEAFFKAHPLPNSARKIDQTLENIRANAQFLEGLQSSDLAKESFWKSLA